MAWHQDSNPIAQVGNDIPSKHAETFNLGFPISSVDGAKVTMREFTMKVFLMARTRKQSSPCPSGKRKCWFHPWGACSLCFAIRRKCCMSRLCTSIVGHSTTLSSSRCLTRASASSSDTVAGHESNRGAEVEVNTTFVRTPLERSGRCERLFPFLPSTCRKSKCLGDAGDQLS